MTPNLEVRPTKASADTNSSNIGSTGPPSLDDEAAEVPSPGADGHVTRDRSGTPPVEDWRRKYALRLAVSDFLVLIWAVYGTQFIWFGFGNARLGIREDAGITELSYWVFSGILVTLWMAALGLIDSRGHRIIGHGTTEYIRVIDASLRLFGTVAIFAFLFRADLARGYLLLALPVGVAALLLARWLWRQWLIAQRMRGRYSARLILVGSTESVAQVAREFLRAPRAGYTVVGACTPTGTVGDVVPGTSIPMMGSVNTVEDAMRVTGADTVAVTSTDELPADKVKQISWNLQAGRQHLILAPSIVDVAGPRLHTRPVAGLPLIHVETPRFSLGQRVAKRSFDVVASIVFIVLLSPVFLGVTLAVKLSSPGPVLYRQQRIGLNGVPFQMLKFRSMRVGADTELRGLLEAQGTAEKPLFKIKDDPRITRVGRYLRKYSLDELPQLLNVLGGSMSLVGPRPQIEAEVALYSDAAKRRLLTRPGLTGLWQVSGRSSLGWEDAVRLDLYYVENWSLASDLTIIMKTGKAVLLPGADAR